ncbi:hypothetical protein DA096_18960 [Vibrio rotiferianus]|jgi:hypothetical protein|uniref:Uncharacterized protein n=2 Tax=Vibrio rotiferianus TaxID=190895 RepID=A0A7Y4E013_9VIBR|nr:MULTISPECIES: hypothetical protein [Vibrio]ASI94874.1 hypothetical protein BSZ04_07635 [Vibrio rotiferianus]NOH47396.1 hypothetical protein [Vibrio rotiferianus]NOH68059.1 hypothetical protein [Vibrio rotiferianus]PIB12773.1 hypothetical protein B853_21831 [Vibrio rotiferianus CAIM 577 = LMG 21460]TMX43763.1 hypothetical protein DA095_02965 [Vibrio rotiferianus]
MKKHLFVTIIASLLVSACSNQQAAEMGMRGSSVNVYAQQMSNMQLCETLFYKRQTNQTLAAIGSEFNRRGLNKKWCDKERNKWYIEKWVDTLITKKEESHTESEVTIQPAI